MFGATLRHDGVERNWFARQEMKRNNRHGIFANGADDVAGRRSVLSAILTDPGIDIAGWVALFAARKE